MGLRDAGQSLSDAIARRLVGALKAGGTPTVDALRILRELKARWLAGAVDRSEVIGTYSTAGENGHIHEHNIHRYHWKCVHCQRTWES